MFRNPLQEASLRFEKPNISSEPNYKETQSLKRATAKRNPNEEASHSIKKTNEMRSY
jgi:hypothetical protein